MTAEEAHGWLARFVGAALPKSRGVCASAEGAVGAGVGIGAFVTDCVVGIGGEYYFTGSFGSSLLASGSLGVFDVAEMFLNVKGGGGGLEFGRSGTLTIGYLLTNAASKSEIEGGSLCVAGGLAYEAAFAGSFCLGLKSNVRSDEVPFTGVYTLYVGVGIGAGGSVSIESGASAAVHLFPYWLGRDVICDLLLCPPVFR